MGTVLSQLIADDRTQCQRPGQAIKGNRKMEDYFKLIRNFSPFLAENAVMEEY